MNRTLLVIEVDIASAGSMMFKSRMLHAELRDQACDWLSNRNKILDLNLAKMFNHRSYLSSLWHASHWGRRADHPQVGKLHGGTAIFLARQENAGNENGMCLCLSSKCCMFIICFMYNCFCSFTVYLFET